jgi:DNA-binding FadR family transcriptional regulator
MLDLIELRRIIEPKAAELAAVRATKEDVAEILSAYEAMAKSEDDQERMETDIAFHSAILKASHNSVLSHFKYAISTYLRAHVDVGESQPQEVVKEDLERHYQIAWSIASGKAKSAYTKTVEMLNLNRSHFEETTEKP